MRPTLLLLLMVGLVSCIPREGLGRRLARDLSAEGGGDGASSLALRSSLPDGYQWTYNPIYKPRQQGTERGKSFFSKKKSKLTRIDFQKVSKHIQKELKRNKTFWKQDPEDPIRIPNTLETILNVIEDYMNSTYTQETIENLSEFRKCKEVLKKCPTPGKYVEHVYETVLEELKKDKQLVDENLQEVTCRILELCIKYFDSQISIDDPVPPNAREILSPVHYCKKIKKDNKGQPNDEVIKELKEKLNERKGGASAQQQNGNGAQGRPKKGFFAKLKSKFGKQKGGGNQSKTSRQQKYKAADDDDDDGNDGDDDDDDDDDDSEDEDEDEDEDDEPPQRRRKNLRGMGSRPRRIRYKRGELLERALRNFIVLSSHLDLNVTQNKTTPSADTMIKEVDEDQPAGKRDSRKSVGPVGGNEAQGGENDAQGEEVMDGGQKDEAEENNQEINTMAQKNDDDDDDDDDKEVAGAVR